MLCNIVANELKVTWRGISISLQCKKLLAPDCGTETIHE